MREANKNPTDFIKKDIITSTVILHEVAELQLFILGIHESVKSWKRNPDYH